MLSLASPLIFLSLRSRKHASFSYDRSPYFFQDASCDHASMECRTPLGLESVVSAPKQFLDVAYAILCDFTRVLVHFGS